MILCLEAAALTERFSEKKKKKIIFCLFDPFLPPTDGHAAKTSRTLLPGFVRTLGGGVQTQKEFWENKYFRGTDPVEEIVRTISRTIARVRMFS